MLNKIMHLILIIDTDFNDVTTTEYFLSGLRHRVISTTKAKKGLEFARSAPPDLLIVGLSMTDKESIENIVAIKRDNITKDVPILALFRTEDSLFIEKMQKVGINEFLIKPIEKTSIVEKVKTILESSKENKTKTVNEIKDHILIKRENGIALITFYSGLKRYVLPEIKNVFKKDFIEKISNDHICIDIRNLPELSEEEVGILEKIILIFGSKKLNIIAGRSLGPILTHGDDLEEKVNFFATLEEFDEYIKKQNSKEEVPPKNE